MQSMQVPVPPPPSRFNWLSWRLADIVLVLLPIGSFLLWVFSLKHVDVHQMNDLGLVSVLPLPIILAVILLNISFCFLLRSPKLRVPVIMLHVFLLIFMLFSVTTFMEEAVRFSTVYRHAGYTEYITRTGSVDPNLDAYFSWPGFFILAALVTQLAGYHTILQYAAWAPVFFNIIYLPAIYVIFTTATTDKRLIWLAVWFFYLTNWIGQDYYSPQGMNYFFYLVIVAVLLKWFKVPSTTQPPFWAKLIGRFGRFSPLAQKLYEWIIAPETLRTPASGWQRAGLLLILIVMFGFVVFSHPLTPFFIFVSVAALIFLRRCTTWWLPFLLAIMIILWIVTMTQSFLLGHSSMIFGNFGQLGSSVTTNVADRVHGNQLHTYVAWARVVMTGLLWGMAFLGGVSRMRKGYRDGTYLLLAVVPFPLIVVQDYGGEMFLRIYLFVLPMMAFFTAILFYTTHSLGVRRQNIWRTLACCATCIMLIGGFLLTRYGNEHMDYITYDEYNGIQHLYQIAPAGSLLIQGWGDAGWQFQDYEKYDCQTLSDVGPQIVEKKDIDALVRYIRAEAPDHPAYIIFTRSQRVSAEAISGEPVGTLDSFEASLLHSYRFQLVYNHPDAQIFFYAGNGG